MWTKYFITILLNWETNKWFLFVILKGYATPNIYPMIFCSICFLRSLEAFSPQLVDSNMPLDPLTRDRISLSAHKHRPVFCCGFDSGTREITLSIQNTHVLPTFQEVSHRKFMKTCPILGAFPLGAYKQHRNPLA